MVSASNEIKTIKEPITICNKLGLHARASAKLVSCASRFESDILLTKDTQTVNAKSIMGVMMLAASQGTHLTLSAIGADAEAAMHALVALINNRFDESE